MSAWQIEMYKTIHEQFEFPNNLSYEYIQGQAFNKLKNQSARRSREQPRKSRPEAPPPEAPLRKHASTREEVEIEQIASYLHRKRWKRWNRFCQNDPEALKVIETAKEIPPEKQARGSSDMILECN
jgi:hypothetical protein